MSTSFYNNYMYYNEVKVDLFCADEPVKQYTLSNINKKTLPGPDCGAHLQSISITPPQVGLDKRLGGIRKNYCATGTVTIIDYKNSVFNRFAEHMKYATEHSSEGAYVTPSICITVKCYTGTEVYDGFVNDYKFNFQGGSPIITLEWTSIPVAKNQQPTNGNAPASPFVQYYTIGGFISAIKEIAKNNPMPKINFKMNGTTKTVDGAELDKDLRFVNDNPDKGSNPSEAVATYDVRKLSAKTGNPVHDALIWLGNNVVTKGDVVSAETGKTLTEEDKNKSIKTKTLRRPLSGTIQKDGSYLLQVIEDPVNPSNEKNEFTELASSIVFVQNGKFAPYKKVSFDKLSGINSSVPDFKNTPLGDRIIIPMTSISFETSFSNLVLQYDILNGINYTTVTANGSDQVSGAPTNGEASAQTTAAAENANSSTTEITFTCYNVMSFSMNCPSAKIAFIVYDEYGEIHPMSGYGTVNEVTYNISGAVVSANVKVSKAFNSIEVSDNNNAAPASGDNQPQ